MRCPGELYDIVGQIKPQLLDGPTKAFYEAERASIDRYKRGSGLSHWDMPAYRCGVMLHILGEKRTPEKVLEEQLRQEGYVIRWESRDNLVWEEEPANVLEDPKLRLVLAVDPKAFGVPSTPLVKRMSWADRMYYGRERSNCLQEGKELSHFLVIDDTSEYNPLTNLRDVVCKPEFYFRNGDLLRQPIEARDTLRHIAGEINPIIRYQEDREK